MTAEAVDDFAVVKNFVAAATDDGVEFDILLGRNRQDFRLSAEGSEEKIDLRVLDDGLAGETVFVAQERLRLRPRGQGLHALANLHDALVTVTGPVTGCRHLDGQLVGVVEDRLTRCRPAPLTAGIADGASHCGPGEGRVCRFRQGGPAVTSIVAADKERGEEKTTTAGDGRRGYGSAQASPSPCRRLADRSPRQVGNRRSHRVRTVATRRRRRPPADFRIGIWLCTGRNGPGTGI